MNFAMVSISVVKPAIEPPVWRRYETSDRLKNGLKRSATLKYKQFACQGEFGRLKVSSVGHEKGAIALAPIRGWFRPEQTCPVWAAATRSSGTAGSAVPDGAGNGGVFAATPEWEWNRPPSVSGRAQCPFHPGHR